MSFVSDFLFGGDDTSAQDATQRLQSEQLQLFKEQAEQARGDVIPLLGQADVDRNLGFEAALGSLQAGQPQFQNAILGLPASLPQTQLPQFGGTAAVFPGQQATPQDNVLAVDSFPGRSEPIPSGLSLADLQRSVFAADKGTEARRTAQQQVNQFLGGAQETPLSLALQEFQGLRKGSSARGRAKQEVKDLLGQDSLQSALSSIFSGQFGGQFGDGGSDPSSLDQPSLSTRSDAELSLGLSIAKGLSNVPTFGIISMFSQAAINNEISKRGGISTGGTGPGSGFGGGEDEAGQVDQGLA